MNFNFCIPFGFLFLFFEQSRKYRKFKWKHTKCCRVTTYGVYISLLLYSTKIILSIENHGESEKCGQSEAKFMFTTNLKGFGLVFLLSTFSRYGMCLDFHCNAFTLWSSIILFMIRMSRFIYVSH